MKSFFWLTVAAVISLKWQTGAFCHPLAFSFTIKPNSKIRNDKKFIIRSTPTDDGATPAEDTSVSSIQDLEQAASLKRELYQLAASYDRGFSATPKARKEANEIIDKLSAINPTQEASQGIDGNSYGDNYVPLKAIWRMIWTSALDVVSLGASPFAGEYKSCTIVPCITSLCLQI